MEVPSGVSYDSLYGRCGAYFESLPDVRAKNSSVRLRDYLVGAMALFALKYPSLLALDQSRTRDEERNLKKLFGLNRIPSDTSMREVLDEVAPQSLHGLFDQVNGQVAEQGHLKGYEVLDGHLLVPMDGVEFFSSTQVHCPYCQVKKSRSKNAAVHYSHAMLAAVIAKPDHSQVLPLGCEPISKQDGAKKNDHELQAARRLWERLWAAHKDKKFLHGGDALFANGPMARAIEQAGHSYLFTVKPDSHESLFAHRSGQGQYYKHYSQKVDKDHWSLEWSNGLALNNASADVRVGFVLLEVTDAKGKVSKFSWATNLKVSKRNVLEIVRCGRARWKIENETFNTLKNQGYQFEHNYGHGKKNLSNVLATLMLLAFLIDQIQELASKPFITVLKMVKTRRRLWEEFRAVFSYREVNSFKHLLATIAKSHSFSGP